MCIVIKCFFQSLQEVLDIAIDMGEKRWGVAREEAVQRVMRYLIIIVILPDKAGPIRTSVKNWGDVEKGMLPSLLQSWLFLFADKDA